jgi:hypothetical protein
MTPQNQLELKEWVIKVLRSCATEAQLECATALGENYLARSTNKKADSRHLNDVLRECILNIKSKC